MASGALFGAAGNHSQSKNLVEFKAGKMTMKGKMVHPDKRKGLLYVLQSDDSLMHFCWKDRTSGTVEDDLIIFPDDIEFKHVTQCTTGRVYVLKFKSSSRKFFFWLQEPKTDKDEDNCRKVNDFLNNPPTPGSSRGPGGSGTGIPSDLSGLGDSDLQSILGNMSQQQLMQLLGGMGVGGGGLSSLLGRPNSGQSTASDSPAPRVQSSPGARTTATTTADTPTIPTQPRPLTASSLPSQPPGSAMPAATPAPAASTGGARKPIQLSDLQNILSNIAVPATPAKEPVDLSQALTPDSMIPILANEDVQARLLPYLPEGETLPKTQEELRNTISSPQFRQALSSFSSALQSGELGPLMTQFGLGEDVSNAAAKGDLEAFVKAMQDAEKKSDESKKEDEKKTDEDMET